MNPTIDPSLLAAEDPRDAMLRPAPPVLADIPVDPTAIASVGPGVDPADPNAIAPSLSENEQIDAAL